MVTVHIFAVMSTNRTLDWSHTIPTNTETVNPNSSSTNNNQTAEVPLNNNSRITDVAELDDRTIQMWVNISTKAQDDSLEICHVCKSSGELIQCDNISCRKSFHPSCVEVDINTLPLIWYCSVACEHQMVSTSNKNSAIEQQAESSTCALEDDADADDAGDDVANNITALGFLDIAAVKACLSASDGDPNIAVDYLMNGIPPEKELPDKGNPRKFETQAMSHDLSSLQSKIRDVSSQQTKKSFGIRTMNGKPTLNRASRMPAAGARQASPPTAAAAGISNLKRKHNELIYVRIGTTEHEAFELENSANPGEHETVWVEWIATGKKQCISRHQIVRNGLQARKRKPPTKFSLVE